MSGLAGLFAATSASTAMKSGASASPRGVGEDRIQAQILLAGPRVDHPGAAAGPGVVDEPEAVGEHVPAEHFVHLIRGDLAWQQGVLVHRKSSCHHFCLAQNLQYRRPRTAHHVPAEWPGEAAEPGHAM